jgi:hypothetical protein
MEGDVSLSETLAWMFFAASLVGAAVYLLLTALEVQV